MKNPCFYGIDMPSQDELIAARLSEAELSDHFGADSLTFLSLEGLAAVSGPRICAACFDGEYCVPVSAGERAAIGANRRG